MKDIFTELYKKVIGVFQKQEEKENNKDMACNRLKLVLMQDRTNLTPYLLERMRGEMIDVLSKYVEMDKEALELNFEAEGESMALMLSIPVVRAKEEDEIQAILKAEEEARAIKMQEDEAENIQEQDEIEGCICEDCGCQDCECEAGEACEFCEDVETEAVDEADEVETVENAEEIDENDEDIYESNEVEVCDWENPECNDVVVSKKTKKRK